MPLPRGVALELLDRQVLHRALEELETQFAEQPLVRAALQQTVAETYRKIGRYPPAVPVQKEALETRRRVLGEDHPKTLASLAGLGDLYLSMGRFDDALDCHREALERSQGVKKKAAQLLGISFRSFRYRLEKLGIDEPRS